MNMFSRIDEDAVDENIEIYNSLAILLDKLGIEYFQVEDDYNTLYKWSLRMYQAGITDSIP